MEVKLQKWGNSLGIRLPKNILDSLGFKENDVLIIQQVDDKFVVSKSRNKKISLKELFQQYDGENLTKEFAWDDVKGKEIW
jgi:antitoxin MazE